MRRVFVMLGHFQFNYERLKTKTEESTHLRYTGLLGEREHLKIKTRLINEKFASVMVSVCDLDIVVYYKL